MYFETGRDNSKYYAHKDNNSPPHFHQSVELLYVLRGEKTVLVGDKQYVLHPNDMLVCAPYVMHRFSPCEQGEQMVATCPTEYCSQFEKLCETMQPSTPVFHDSLQELLPAFTALKACDNDVLFTGIINTILGKFMEKVPFVPIQNNKEQSLYKHSKLTCHPHLSNTTPMCHMAKVVCLLKPGFSSVQSLSHVRLFATP